MPAHQHAALRELHTAHREARLASNVEMVPDEQILHVGVIFHILTPKTNRELRDVMPTAESILQMMNAGFSHAISPLHDLHAIEQGTFLQDAEHRELYRKHKNLACSPNMQFVLAEPVRLYYIPFAHKHSGSDVKDMDYWDQILKRQTAPAIRPHKCYNIWVVMDIHSVLLGYGNFPKVNPSPDDLALDGFVYFISPSPYDLHVTAVHETGHVYSLNHPFNHIEGDEYDDGIEDTPPQNTPDFGPVWFKDSKWPSSIVKKTGERSYHLLSCYMNYVDDSCMFMFTKGQCRQIRDTALTVRSSWNLEQTELAGLRGGSPWVSASLQPPGQRKQQPHSKQRTTFVTQYDPFPFRKKYIAPNHDPLKFRPRFENGTTLNTFGGIFDVCGSCINSANSTFKTVDTLAKMMSAFSFACC